MAYTITPNKTNKLEYLPCELTLPKDGLVAELDYLNRASKEEVEACRALLNEEIVNGCSYPYNEAMDEAAFAAYFLAADCFVLRSSDSQQTVIATFYVKPNYPGACNHIANLGIIVARAYRRRGVGRALGALYPYMARDLGYRASIFNLVFVDNQPGVTLWRDTLRFAEVGRVPGAVRRADGALVDALILHRAFDALPAPTPPLANLSREGSRS